jgi:hypothetical protein
MTAPRTLGHGGLITLRWLVVLAALGPVLFPADRHTVIPADVRLQSGILWILSWLPALVYLMSSPDRRPPLPLLPVIGIAHGLYYALQVTLGVENANQVALVTLDPLDPRTDYRLPVQLALVGWICLLIGYYTTKALTPPKPLPMPSGLRVLALRSWAVRLLLGGLVMEIIRQALPIPVALRGALHLATMLSQVGMVLLIVLNIRGHLEPRHRTVLYAGIVGTMLLAIGTGSIANGVFAALAAVLATWLGGQRVKAWWVLAAIPVAAVFVSLRGVAMDYRRVAWFTEQELPVVQRSQVLLGMLAARVESDGVIGTVEHGWEVVSTRSANLDLFADVVRRTPRHVPYWNGQTYLSLVGIAIPRFLWPGKPQKRLGQEFGHRYGYLGDYDRSTSVNLPYFIEFYCNFGAWGVLFGMLLVGFIYAWLEQRLNTPKQGILVSVCAIVLLLPLINIESDFSLIFGGLLLNGVALWFVLKFVGRSAQAKGASRVVNGPLPEIGRIRA